MFVPEPNGQNFTPPPAGSHAAICYRFIDLGTQMVEWKGASKTQRKVLLGWELPNELMEDGRPFTITRRYTWSMSDKSNLRHDLEAWRGRAFSQDDFAGPLRFNIKNILGKACMLSIVQDERDGNVYANLKSVSALPKGMNVPDLKNEIVYVALERGLFSQAAFDGLSDKLKETIKGSPEYKELMSPSMIPASTEQTGDDFVDEVPF
jgi:hypothetical protein